VGKTNVNERIIAFVQNETTNLPENSLFETCVAHFIWCTLHLVHTSFGAHFICCTLHLVHTSF